MRSNPMTTATILLAFANLAAALVGFLPPEYAVPASAVVFSIGALGRAIVMAKQNGQSVAEVLADAPDVAKVRHPDTPADTELGD